MSENLDGFRRWFIIGAVVLLIGLALQWYPASIIQGYSQQSTLPNMSPYDVNVTRDNINTWRIMQAFWFQPVSLTFFSAGILILAYSVVSGVFAIGLNYSKKRLD